MRILHGSECHKHIFQIVMHNAYAKMKTVSLTSHQYILIENDCTYAVQSCCRHEN